MGATSRRDKRSERRNMDLDVRCSRLGDATDTANNVVIRENNRERKERPNKYRRCKTKIETLAVKSELGKDRDKEEKEVKEVGN